MKTEHTGSQYNIKWMVGASKVKVVCGNGRIVASCENDKTSYEEQQSNAKLIAAAPELLDLLNKVANCPGYDSASDCTLVPNELIEEIRTLITKATNAH